MTPTKQLSEMPDPRGASGDIATVRQLAKVIELPVGGIGELRTPRPRALVSALNKASPTPKARVFKQSERRVVDVPGVVEITYSSGRVVWYLRFRSPLSRKMTSIKLGQVGVMSFSDMVVLAKKYRDGIVDGRCPKSARMALSDFIERYAEPWLQGTQRSWRDTLARLKHHVLPVLGDKALEDIDHSDGVRLIRTLLEGRALVPGRKLSHATVNRILMAVRCVFRRAVELGFISENAFKHVRQLKESPPSPNALESEDICHFLAVLEGEPELYVLLIKLLLATAARIKELLALQISDIDYTAGVLHLRMTKAGEPQTLPLTTTVLGILEALKPLRRPGNAHLFPARSGDGHMAAPYKWLRKVLAKAGLEQAGFHLFRKTVATQAMQLPGADVLTVSRLLRHKSVRTLEVHYLATPQKRLRQVANDIGEALLGGRERRAS